MHHVIGSRFALIAGCKTGWNRIQNASKEMMRGFSMRQHIHILETDGRN